MPRPNVHALRKPNIERYGNNSPTPYAWRPLRQLLSIFVFEVSQASHIQEEDITPLFTNDVFGQGYPNPSTKVMKYL